MSVCSNCSKARRAAAISNAKEGWIGCSAPMKQEISETAFIQNVNAKEIGIGWISRKRPDDLSEGCGGAMINEMPLTKEATYCPYRSEVR